MADLSTVIKQTQERIRFLRQRGSDPTVARELADREIDLHILQAAAGLVSRYVQQAHPRRGYISEESNIGVTRTILMEACGPLHINDILQRLKLYTGREVKRGVLTSRLSKMARDRKTFAQVAPATYGLIEYADRTDRPVEPEEGRAEIRAIIEHSLKGKKPPSEG